MRTVHLITWIHFDGCFFMLVHQTVKPVDTVLLEGVTLAGKHDGKQTNEQKTAKQKQVSLGAITFAFM